MGGPEVAGAAGMAGPGFRQRIRREVTDVVSRLTNAPNQGAQRANRR
jgi:hypothetical protein